jgi:hypothetical protein
MAGGPGCDLEAVPAETKLVNGQSGRRFTRLESQVSEPESLGDDFTTPFVTTAGALSEHNHRNAKPSHGPTLSAGYSLYCRFASTLSASHPTTSHPKSRIALSLGATLMIRGHAHASACQTSKAGRY